MYTNVVVVSMFLWSQNYQEVQRFNASIGRWREPAMISDDLTILFFNLNFFHVSLRALWGIAGSSPLDLGSNPDIICVQNSLLSKHL